MLIICHREIEHWRYSNKIIPTLLWCYFLISSFLRYRINICIDLCTNINLLPNHCWSDVVRTLIWIQLVSIFCDYRAFSPFITNIQNGKADNVPFRFIWMQMGPRRTGREWEISCPRLLEILSILLTSLYISISSFVHICRRFLSLRYRALMNKLCGPVAVDRQIG